MDEFSQQLTIKMPIASVQDFIAKYGRLLSVGGLYIPTNQLRPMGSLVPFKILKSDGSLLLAGIGKVVWAKTQAEANGGFFGLGLNYYQFDPPNLSQLEELLQLAGIKDPPKLIAPAVQQSQVSIKTVSVPRSSAPKKKNIVLGIDLGTTNSACAIVQNNMPYLISSNGQNTIPSIVAIDDNGRVLVGHEAKIQMVKNIQKDLKQS